MSKNNEEDRKIQASHQQRLARLAEDKRRILAMAPEKALDHILDHPRPDALVHSMAEEDLFFLVQDIGPQDALELLSLASNRQWEYLLDLEIWYRDRIRPGALTHWMHLLYRADAARFIRWTTREKPELLEYYLSQAIDVVVREDPDDPEDLPDGFFTYDGVFYARIRESFLNGAQDEQSRDQREHFIYQMLGRLADENLFDYQATLLRSANVMPSESEEESFRFRNVRLAEKGFLPFDEAVGVYAPVRPEAMHRRRHPYKPGSAATDFTVPVPVQHTALISRNTIFSTALWKIEAGELLQELQLEFACLCNRIISADQEPVREREELRKVVHKACGYLSLGLHRLAGTEAPPDPAQSATILCRYPLADIFRTGYGLAVELKEQARKWKARSWFAKNDLPLGFWGERLVGYIGGLLLARPKYFDNYRTTDSLYREFASLEDVRDARSALNEAVAFDEILRRMNPDTGRFAGRHFLTHENLLLTLWARDRLGVPAGPAAIPIGLFRPFFEKLWEAGSKGRRIKDSTKSDFLAWLSARTGLATHELSEKAGAALENLFARIEDEYAAVDAGDLDPRFVHLFMLEKES